MGGLFVLFYQISLISLIIFGLVLAFRFVRAFEKAADALETIAKKTNKNLENQ